jgi:putative inorganic carbon (hco3(-)) transporter
MQRLHSSSEWTYVLTALGAFVFTPELRRIVNWHGNYDPLNTFAVIPLIMLCPIAFLTYRRRNRLTNNGFAFVMIAWAAAFSYATFVAAAHGSIIQAIYADAQFCLPATIGAWLLTRDETMAAAHARLAHALFIFGAIAGAYGIFQYVVAPPWDTAWMQNIDAESFGMPQRFAIRVFGVLNGPGVFALFLGSVIVFNLPYLRAGNKFTILALLVIIIALILSLVRSAWLAVFIGIVVFIFLSPKRLQAMRSLSLVGLFCCIGICAALLVAPNADLTDTIFQRFATFSHIQDDPSALERRQTAEDTLQMALDQPAGAGMGVTGGSTKLGDADAQAFSGAPSGPIDNGFVSRFFEMGVPGFAAFIVACFASFFVLAHAYATFARRRNRPHMILAASCIAVQVLIFAVNTSGDDQQALLGTLFFAALALPLMPSVQKQAATSPLPQKLIIRYAHSTRP